MTGRRKTRVSIILLIALAGIAFVTQMCVPPPAEPEDPVLSEAEKAKRDRDCQIALSNGWEYYKNREFDSSVRNYTKLVNLGCGEEYASDVFLYFGRAYIELGNLDSAVWAFQQGLKYLPGDKNLLENIAYTLGRMDQPDRQIGYYYQLIEVDSTNTEAYKSLADLLREQEKYEDLIFVLSKWLEVEPDNSRVKSDLIATYSLAGKDPLSLMQSQWMANRGTAQYGIDYARGLIESMDFAAAYRVLESVIEEHPSSKMAYQTLAGAALDEGEIERAIVALKGLYNLNRTDYKTALELSKAYTQRGAYAEALEWAQTGLSTSNNAGEAYYVRAEVYFAAADECSAERESGLSNFHDKLVYNMAYEDYSAAVANGYRRARTRADFLEKNLIPQKGDWFLTDPNQTIFKPEGACYTWINREVKRP
ncbi:MAG: hypothetical protein KAU50_11645 [Candidatus Marinimicrobia bacterium]|nr:hypothetical protein [Candidatus Neomarinimicrobiota bacterium]